MQALEIVELRDQLQDAQDAITEAHTHAAGLQKHTCQLEAQVASLQQQLSQALRCGIPAQAQNLSQALRCGTLAQAAPASLGGSARSRPSRSTRSVEAIVNSAARQRPGWLNSSSDCLKLSLLLSTATTTASVVGMQDDFGIVMMR